MKSAETDKLRMVGTGIVQKADLVSAKGGLTDDYSSVVDALHPGDLSPIVDTQPKRVDAPWNVDKTEVAGCGLILLVLT